MPVPRTSIESRSGSQPATPARPTMRSSSTSRPGIARIAVARRAQRRDRLAEQLLAVHRRRGGARRRASRQSRLLGLVDSTRLTQRSTTLSSNGRPAEVEHRGLGEAADDLVGRGDDEVGAGRDRVLGEVGVEAQVRSPGLVDDQRQPALMGDLGEGGDVGAGAEVGGGDDDRADRAGMLIERGRRALAGVRQWATPSSGSSSGATKAGRSPPRIEPVDHRGVDVALHDHPLAGVGEREAGGLVSLRGAVDQEPAAPGAPGLGGEPLRLAGRASAPGRRRRPRSARGCRGGAHSAPASSRSAGSAPGPPLWPGTWKRPGSRAA